MTEPAYICPRCGFPTIRQPLCHKCLGEVVSGPPGRYVFGDFAVVVSGPDDGPEDADDGLGGRRGLREGR